MKAQELDWLRDASVNLLSLDLARWTDVVVVPDKRVGDLLRELPTGRSTSLTLADGIALAKRAGAGQLVMGDFFRVGSGARLVANIFDVATATRIRTITQQTSVADSLLGAFAPLARGALAVPAPSDARAGDFGTQRLDAYRAYLRGIQFKNRFRLAESEKELRAALALDSTFALAHAVLANVLAFGEVEVSKGERLQHALAAQRLGANLPKRDRALITAGVAWAHGDYLAMCDAAAPLVAADSTDVEALYAVATCEAAAPPVQGPVKLEFRTSWNRSLWASQTILRLDPGFYPAFDRTLDVLVTPDRGGCIWDLTAGQCTPSLTWLTAVLRVADSLDTSFGSTVAERTARRERQSRERPDSISLRIARRIAEQWVADDNNGSASRQGLAEVMLRQGQTEEAYTVLRRGPLDVTPGNQRGLTLAIELAVKTGRAAEARAWMDSLVRASPDNNDNAKIRGRIDLMFARTARFRRALWIDLEPMVEKNGLDRTRLERYADGVPRMYMHLPVAGLAAAESSFVVSLGPRCDRSCRGDLLMLSAPRTPNAPRTWYPDTSVFGGGQLLRLVMRGDTAALWRYARGTAVSARRPGPYGSVDGALDAIMAHLALADSAGALTLLRFYVDTLVPPRRLVSRGGQSYLPVDYIAAMRMRGELAAALGHRNEAVFWLDRVLNLWAAADAEFAPDIERLRALRARMAVR